MKEETRNKGRLEHIQMATSYLLEADKSGTIDGIQEKSIQYYGLVKLLEIIGEASNMLTDDFKEMHPQTNWRAIIGLRNVLVHGYYHIDLNELKNVVINDIPALHRQITEYLSEF